MKRFGRLACRVCNYTHNRDGSSTLYELTESKLLKTHTWGLMHYDCGADMIKFLSSKRRWTDVSSYTLKRHKRKAA